MPLTAKQCEYLAIAWECFESEPKIDYHKFHLLANLSTPASAREVLRITKKKLKDEYASSTDSSKDGTISTPKSSAKTTAKASAKATPKGNAKGSAKAAGKTAAGSAGGKGSRNTGKRTRGVSEEFGTGEDEADDDDEEDELARPITPLMKRIKRQAMADEEDVGKEAAKGGAGAEGDDENEELYV